MNGLKFETVAELLQWLHQQYDAEREFPTQGRVIFHVFKRKLVGGGVEGNLRLGSIFKEADMKFQEETPGVLTVAVVPCGKSSIDYTKRKSFPGTAKLDELREAFPNGRNINHIVDELLAE